MSLEVRKQERETSQALIRRFSTGMKKSGILVRARKIRFRERMKSPDMQKKAALRREELKIEYKKKEKLGKIEKKPFNRSRY
ncbi:MAG: hypothetical protein ABH813_01665 [Patescibacteria group bacterium]